MASTDIERARHAAASGFDTVWVGERYSPSAPARLAALAAATDTIDLGMGLVPLTGRGAAHLSDTLSTLTLIAPGRVVLAFDLPTTLAMPRRPAWSARLDEVLPAARAAGVPVAVRVSDVAAAVLVADRVDRLVLRGADAALASRVVASAARSETTPEVEVWLDAAPHGADETCLGLLRPLVTERLALGHETTRIAARTLGLAGLSGDVESAYARGRLDEAASLVPDELVHATCLVDDDALDDRLAEYREAGVHRVGIAPHDPTGEGTNALLDAVAAGLPA